MSEKPTPEPKSHNTRSRARASLVIAGKDGKPWQSTRRKRVPRSFQVAPAKDRSREARSKAKPRIRKSVNNMTTIATEGEGEQQKGALIPIEPPSSGAGTQRQNQTSPQPARLFVDDTDDDTPMRTVSYFLLTVLTDRNKNFAVLSHHFKVTKSKATLCLNSPQSKNVFRIQNQAFGLNGATDSRIPTCFRSLICRTRLLFAPFGPASAEKWFQSVAFPVSVLHVFKAKNVLFSTTRWDIGWIF